MLQPKLYTRVALTRAIPEIHLKQDDTAIYIDYLPVTEGEPGAILEIFDALGESLTVVVVSFSAIAPYEMEKTMLKEQITLALVNFAQALVANQTDANSRERIQQATERFLAAYRGQSEVVYRSVNEAKDALRYAVVATLYKTEEEISEINLLNPPKPSDPWQAMFGMSADDADFEAEMAKRDLEQISALDYEADCEADCEAEDIGTAYGILNAA